jgi:hypothetical protein
MECPVCASLHCEHSKECQTEAVATLQHRASRLARSAADRSSHDGLETVILESRKRQARIATELHGHREIAHPYSLSQPTARGKKATA